MTNLYTVRRSSFLWRIERLADQELGGSAWTGMIDKLGGHWSFSRLDLPHMVQTELKIALRAAFKEYNV